MKTQSDPKHRQVAAGKIVQIANKGQGHGAAGGSQQADDGVSLGVVLRAEESAAQEGEAYRAHGIDRTVEESGDVQNQGALGGAAMQGQKQGAGVQANHGDADFHRTEFIAENTDEQLCQDVPHHGEGHHQGTGFSGEPDAQSKAGKVLGDAIKPRLMEAQADLNRVICIDETERSLSLLDERIGQAVKATNAKLLILDPLQGYLGRNVDMNRANEIRDVLKHLTITAEQTGCAIVLIGHLNKAVGSNSAYRGLGSMDFHAAARSVLLVGRMKKGPRVRVIVHDKSSLAPEGKSVAFSLSGSVDVPQQLHPGGGYAQQAESYSGWQSRGQRAKRHSS